MSDQRDRARVERYVDELLANPLTRRRLLRRGAGGALGLSMAGFLAACGGDDNGGGGGEVIPKGEIASRLSVSNWPLYIDKSVLKDFEKEFGTKVKYTEEINDNTEFFGKVRQQLERGRSGGRDMFVVTDWMAGRMIQLDYVQKLDKSAIPNVTNNLIKALESPSFDPNRDYSAPWQSGMTGLIYRADKIDEPSSINEIFDSKLKGKVTMLTEMRDTVGLTMLGMGKDPASAPVEDAQAAIDKIDKANRDGQIRRFTGNDYTKDITKGDTWLIYGWSGDAVQLQADNKNIKFVFPDEGVMIWSDNMEIPVGAPEPYTAQIFMNYVYDPEVQATIAEFVNFVPPVKGVKEVLVSKDPELAENELIFPSDELLEQTHIFRALDPEEEQDLDARFQEVIGA